MIKTYFYKKNNLDEKAIGILGMDLDKIKAMTFENLEGETFTQEQLREKYIQDNHYNSYTVADYLLSKTFYEYPKIVDEEIVGKTDEERKIEGSLGLAENEIIENGVLLVLTDDEMKIKGLKDLEDGEYISGNELISVPYDGSFLIKKWNKETHVWEEGATVQEVKTAYENLLNEYYVILQNTGFKTKYNGQDVTQVCDTDTISKMETSLAVYERLESLYGAGATSGYIFPWNFPQINNVELNFTEMFNIQIEGITYIGQIDSVRGELLEQEANLGFTIEEFIGLSDSKGIKSAYL